MQASGTGNEYEFENMSATDELKPCPFCGSKAKIVTGCDAEGDGVAHIYCTNRHISDSCAAIFVERVDERTARQDAIKMWNRRVGEDK